MELINVDFVSILQITAITVGNLLNKTNEARPIICVVNAEGAIHLFSVRSSVGVVLKKRNLIET